MSPEELWSSVRSIESRLHRIEELLDTLQHILPGFRETHVSVARAAELLRVSEKTVRRYIRRGTLTLSVVPGTRTSGIALADVQALWLPIQRARIAAEREKKESARHAPRS